MRSSVSRQENVWVDDVVEPLAVRQRLGDPDLFLRRTRGQSQQPRQPIGRGGRGLPGGDGALLGLGEQIQAKELQLGNDPMIAPDEVDHVGLGQLPQIVERFAQPGQRGFQLRERLHRTRVHETNLRATTDSFGAYGCAYFSFR
jgi:hypothetical protein